MSFFEGNRIFLFVFNSFLLYLNFQPFILSKYLIIKLVYTSTHILLYLGANTLTKILSSHKQLHFGSNTVMFFYNVNIQSQTWISTYSSIHKPNTLPLFIYTNLKPKTYHGPYHGRISNFNKISIISPCIVVCLILITNVLYLVNIRVGFELLFLHLFCLEEWIKFYGLCCLPFKDNAHQSRYLNSAKLQLINHHLFSHELPQSITWFYIIKKTLSFSLVTSQWSTAQTLLNCFTLLQKTRPFHCVGKNG